MMRESTDHFWKEGDASIYPILKQLLKEKLIKSIADNTESNRPRKIYTITDAGRNVLQEWLIKDPEPTQSRNELLLKVFFGWNTKPDVMIHHLKNYRHKIATALYQYRSSNLAKKS